MRALVATTFAFLLSASSFASDPWLYSGRIGGTFIYNSMSDADLEALLDLRVSQNVSILELDSQLSYHLTDQEFAEEVEFLDKAAGLAHDRGLKAVIYYPTFEVLTRNAIDSNNVIAPSTFGKDNPDWIQQGIDGTPNVFYGGLEVWVAPSEESAWMSPNSGYKDYFISRVEQLAATDLDGVWLDVPIYLDTGTLWVGTEPGAAADFIAWTIDQGLNGGAGFTVPTEYDMSNPGFRAWIKWRHINVANFLEDVRAAAQAVDPDFAVIVENFPMDYSDATAYGLDGSYLPEEDNLIHVWETDSVSNSQAMKWSTPDDFENKLAMLKWGKSVQPDQPSWSFAYGFEPLDAGLTLAATVATQNVPFESQTPTMLTSVGSEFRRNWFGYVADNEDELLVAQRVPNLGIWYSSSTRDFQDYDVSGKFGIFSVTTPPTADDTWWAKRPGDSVVTSPHLGGYRGMSAAMMRMDIPYTVIHGRDNGPLAQSTELDLLILPSVGSMSVADASYIRQYVQNGGTILATGALPGTLDETGAARNGSIIADLFDFPAAPSARVNKFGNGLAIYRPDLDGTTLFGEQLDANVANATLSELEKLVRIHVEEPFTVEGGEDVFIDRAILNEEDHLLYLVNYSGLQLPLVQAVKTVKIHYNAPEGKMVTSVVASSPDVDGLNGFAPVNNRGNGVYTFEVPVDQFAMLEVKLSDAPSANRQAYAGPQFENPAHQEAAVSGLAFVLDHMRNSAAPEPYNFGVYTNLLHDETASNEIYTGGHNMTAEHMGLLLRSSACMNDQAAYEEAYSFVRDVMYSPLYHVPNWSIERDNQRPFQFYDDFRGNWFNANAPLDDLRVIHGLIDGYENFGHEDANDLANSMFEGLYWTSVSDRDRDSSFIFPSYSGGLVGFAWDWSGLDDNTLAPAPAIATGTGFLGTDLIPVDYQDLGTVAHAAARDHRWDEVLQSMTQLLLDSEITLSGLYYNGYKPDGTWTGDFEFQGSRPGEHLKIIQVLWTAIHLARASRAQTDALTATEKSLAQSSAERSLAFFKDFYQNNNRVPEYLKFNGTDVEECVNNQPANCLLRGTENLFNGEARIYAQIARLALLLGDSAFSNQIINEKIITDRVANPANPRYGLIGVSTTSTNDAEAWNVLESVFSLCLNAVSLDDGAPVVSNNNPPVANNDTLTTSEETPVTITVTQLLSNDTDPDRDSLIVAGLPSRSANGGSVELLDSGDWRYTPDIGFSGADTVSYAISDGNGGTAIGQIDIDVLIVPKTTHLTQTVAVLAGALNFGEVEFLSSDDIDTYDVDSEATATGNVVDVSISGNVEGRDEVSRLIMTYSGHYSVPNVAQETFLYNFVTDSWVSFDNRIVGDQSDSIVRIDLTENPQDFIAANGETRLRVRGVQATQAATIWANSVQWLAYRGVQSTDNNAPANNPPVTSAISASTAINTAVAITLTGTDEDGDPITYSIDTSGLSGTVSGRLPDLTYTPSAGFTGNDSFTYTASDGIAASAAATVTVSVLASGIISNVAASITLDGDLTEWAAFVPFADDPDDVTGAADPLDWRRAWMAHDGANYYIAYSNDGPVNVSWGQTVYFDIDDNPATGAQFGLPFGADRVLQGSFLYSYAGTGDDWKWDFIEEVDGASANGNFEYRIPLAAMSGSERLKVAFVGSNVPYGGTVEDLHPDGVYTSTALNRDFTYTAVAPSNTAPDATDLELITTQGSSAVLALNATDVDDDTLNYTVVDQPQNGVITGIAPALVYQPASGFNGTDSFTFQVSDGTALSRLATVSIIVQTIAESQIPSNPVTQINVDGLTGEWTALRYFDDDPDDVTGAENPVDYLRAAMAHDAGFFYLTFSNDGQDLALLQDWLFTVYIDTDSNPSTGYQSGLAIGADHMQQGSAVHSYSGTGEDWVWTPLANTPRAASGNTVEMAIPRQAIGDPTELQFVLIGDNLSLGGGIEDVYPDGTYDSGSATRFLSYRSDGSPSEPVALAAVDGSITPISGRQAVMQNATEIVRAEGGESEAAGVESEAAGVESETKGKKGSGAIGFGILSLAGIIAFRRRACLNT